MDTLAFYIYPLPQGTSFTANDLSVSDNVRILFDYMQIFLAVISKEGWEFLIQQYGYDGLFEINSKSGWIDCERLDEFIEVLEYEKEREYRGSAEAVQLELSLLFLIDKNKTCRSACE